jgi:hypothetical protein
MIRAFLGSILIFFTVPLLISCNDSEIPKISQPRVLLEIDSNAQGLFDVIGKSKYFRLNSDGTVAFEIPDHQKLKPGTTNQTADVNRTINATISENDVHILMAAIREAIEALPNTYHTSCCCTDTKLDFDIAVNLDSFERRARVSGFCDIDDIKKEENWHALDFPPSVSRLFVATENIRWKYGDR